MTEIISEPSRLNSQLDRRFFVAIVSYFCLHVLLRVVISDSLDYDEAEQAFLSQWLLSGYTEQPPLYTWLQYGLFTLFGEGVLAVSVLKNGLLLLTYVFVFDSCRIVLGDSRRAVIASLSLLLIPQIGWESQRDMTHTTLVVMSAAATFWQCLCLYRDRSFFNYLLLGIVLGVGILAKANFLLFLAVLVGSLASGHQTRKILFTPKFIVSLVIALAMSSDYLLWMYHNQDIVFSTSHKFKRAIDNYYTKGLLSLIANSFLFLTPLWAIYLVMFPRGYRGQLSSESQLQQLVRRYFIVFGLTLIVVVLTFKVTYVKDRWLQPLLFLFPLFFLIHVPEKSITSGRFRIFLRVSLLCALFIYVAFTVRVAGASYFNNFCRMNFPFDNVAESIQQDGFERGLIVSDNRFLAGNLRLHLPGSTALIPEYRFEEHVDLHGITQAIFVWMAEGTPQPPDLLRGYARQLYGVELNNKPVRIIEKPQKYGRGESVKIGIVSLVVPTSVEVGTTELQ